MCEVVLDDWTMLVYVDVLFTCDECSFDSLGVGPILRNGCGFWGRKVFIHSFIHSFIREMSAG